ncbi:MAG: MarR family transcriptional regulator [Burkholderiaceae bacterium]|nr:MAG: MarR family transcriptional regulator [Burkholderiaceae bacterium]
MTKQVPEEALTDLYIQPGHLLRRAQQISASMFHDELGQFVTPVQYAILRTLIDHPGIDQVSLAGLVAMDTSTAASVAIRLEEKKLLVRNIDPSNRRQRALFVTDAGMALMRRTGGGIARLHDRLFEGFTDAEEDTFMALLQKLVHINNSQSRAPFARLKKQPSSMPRAIAPQKEKLGS